MNALTTTLLTAGISLSPLSLAEGAHLVYGLDFSGLQTQALTNISNQPGGTAITTAKTTGYINYNDANKPVLLNPDETISKTSGLSHTLVNNSFKIASSTGISGLSLNEGVAISTHIYTGATAWRDVFSFTMGGCTNSAMNGEYRFENNGAGAWNFYGPTGFSISNIGNIANDTWAHFGFNLTTTGLEVYINGAKQNLGNNFNFGENAYITSLQGGSTSGSNGLVGTNKHLLHQFGLYDASLKQEDFAYLSTHVLSQSIGETIPEPTTTTLSLMGLSALLLRRRKHSA